MKYFAKIILINISIMVLLFAIVEGVYSFYVYTQPPASAWFMEHPDQTMRFDPITGISLSQTPSRVVRITRGKIEFIGTVEGNAQGFPDRDDFELGQPNPEIPRIAVFGDSFSAASYLGRNWPDRAEDMFLAAGQQVQLYNFSGARWGLANWASVIKGLLQDSSYEFDGLIFAVWKEDLQRRFFYADYEDISRRTWGLVPNWDPKLHPRSREEAVKILEQHGPSINAHKVSTESFNEVLKGKALATTKWRFVLTDTLKKEVYWRAARYIRRLASGEERPNRSEPEELPGDQEKLKLYSVIRDYAAARNLPVLVVYIWGRDGLFEKDLGIERPYLEETRAFAKHIGATFVDGGEAFEGISRDWLEQLWLPYDHHWGQGASDVFAMFMLDHIRDLSDRSRDF